MSDTVASVPIPPVDAENKTICCEYCPVACGYQVYIWPEGTDGGRAATDNALGIDYPQGALSGKWPSQNMHTVIDRDGQRTNVIKQLPDKRGLHGINQGAFLIADQIGVIGGSALGLVSMEIANRPVDIADPVDPVLQSNIHLVPFVPTLLLLACHKA